MNAPRCALHLLHLLQSFLKGQSHYVQNPSGVNPTPLPSTVQPFWLFAINLTIPALQSFMAIFLRVIINYINYIKILFNDDFTVIIDIISCLKVISENTGNLRKLETINVNLSGGEHYKDRHGETQWSDFSYLDRINRRLESIEKKLED